MPSIIQRAAELRQSSGLNAMDALRQAREELIKPNTNSTNNTGTPGVPTIANTTGLPPGFNFGQGEAFGGGDDSAPSIDYNNNVVSSGQKGDSMYIPAAASLPGSPTVESARASMSTANNTTIQATSNTQGNSSTVTAGGYSSPGASVDSKNKTNVIEGKTNQVLGDVVANYDTNKVTDRVQAEEQKLAAEAKAMETDTELKRYAAEKQALADEEDRIQKQKASEDAQNLVALQEKERARNEAAIAMAEAKSEAAERELAIANDVELQKSNVAFAKLGLTLSTAAATSAQQIFTTGVYNLSKLKSENAYANANLRVEVAKVEFEHTAKVNDIINKSSEKSYTIRKTLNDDMNKIKNSIIDNRLTRQENIDKAVDNYQKAILENEANTLELIKKSATALDDTVKSMYDTLKVKESYNQDKINSVATSGKWFTMSPAARLEYEKGAGLPKGTVIAQIRGEISKGVVKELEGIPLSSGKLNGIINEALQLMDTGGIPMSQAIQSALLNSPEYQTQLKVAQAKKNKVGGSGGTKASGKAGFVDTVKGADGKWYNRYKDPVTGKVTSEVSDKQFDEGGKLNTLSTKNNDDGETPIGG